ncbi:MAG: hydantoinase/oxoprolinase family protein [Anaerolineae bacterium]
MTSSTYRLGFDIGGTFTDFAMLDAETGELRIYKSLTTPSAPAVGALSGMRAFLERDAIGGGQVTHVAHGTTLVANALIERKGATVGLMTTQGFRDILEIRTEQRYDIYDLFLKYPDPIVPRRLRRGVGERTDRDGRILAAPDPAEVRTVVEDFRAAGVQAIAVCFLHAFRNPTNERAVRDIIRAAWPEIPVSLSSDVAPEIREYERTSTTVANAYVQPVMRDYLDQIQDGLSDIGFRGAFYPMLSSGGTASVQTASAIPVQLVESGPAAGAMAAAYFGELSGRKELISFDMGGTTAKIALIQEGRPGIAPSLEVARVARFKKGSGIPLQIPTIEMLEIGAGGGSIASIDGLGLTRVGPRSAGADPGPACYGRGGTEPTVTDADLLLGYLNPGYFLGGAMQLDLAAAEAALGRLGEKMGLGPVETAWAIHQIVNENMAGAVKIHVIEKAQDPRRYALLAYGGGGPVHATGVAKALAIKQVICPPAAGVASAVGLLVAPNALELARSYPVLVDGLDWGEIAALYRDMEAQAQAALAQAGVSPEHVQFERSVDGRFAGQLHEINIDLPPGLLTDGDAGPLLDQFRERYAILYGHLPRGIPIEFLSWRLTGPRPAPAAAPAPRRAGRRRSQPGSAQGPPQRLLERPCGASCPPQCTTAMPCGQVHPRPRSRARVDDGGRPHDARRAGCRDEPACKSGVMLP